MLVDAKLTLAAAESITGGGIADAIVERPRCERVLPGRFVAYDNAVKSGALGVDPALIAEHGAVSEDVALAMACGARERLGSDIAIATTGIAGPTGATEGKPVGLVWFAVADASGARARSTIFPGDRAAIRRRAIAAALDMAYRSVVRSGQPAPT